MLQKNVQKDHRMHLNGWEMGMLAEANADLDLTTWDILRYIPEVFFLLVI